MAYKYKQLTQTGNEVQAALDKVKTMGTASAEAGADGGLTPATAAGDNGKFLRGDGSWADALSPSEKAYLTEQLFQRAFSGSITAKKYTAQGVETTSEDPTVVASVVFTLITQYDGENVDVDTTPSGWFKVETGKYQKTVTTVTGGNVASGNVAVNYTVGSYTGSKTISGASASVKRFIVVIKGGSTTAPTAAEIAAAAETDSYLVSSAAYGKLTLAVEDGKYAWICYQNGLNMGSVTQLGVDWLNSNTPSAVSGVTYKETALGSFNCYRSKNAGNGKEQDVVLA